MTAAPFGARRTAVAARANTDELPSFVTGEERAAYGPQIT